ncbi:F-box domain protein [Aspergillus keveii]|uniref:F-box domain protein n=1 Tax=Aspergillus keveii TaxID=714993 RepID=A0ABR4FY45_9EURO
MDPPRSLPTLPFELVTEIGSYLCPSEEQGSQSVLSQLTQTCKALRDIFQPRLFQVYEHYSQPVSRLVSFLRVISSRPDLAAAVTTVMFDSFLKPTSVTILEKEFVDTCITNLGLPVPVEDWHLEGTHRHLPIETLLAYTPNIESLTLPVNEEWNLDLLPAFLEASPKIEFLRLKSLSIYYYFIAGDHWAIDYGQIAPLLQASPNLEHLSLPSLEGFWEGHENPPLPRLDSLKTLDLGESAAGMFLITSLLKSCKILRKFELYWLSSTGYDESHEDWSTLEVWDALKPLKSTIEDITFEASSDIPLGSPTAASISSLSDFTKLRTLKVVGRSLEGMYQAWSLKAGSSDMDEFVAQLLPSGIRELAIWFPSRNLIPALLALAEAKLNGLYPDLTKLEIGPSPVLKEWLPRPEWNRNEAALREGFARAGIQLKMEIPHVPPEMMNIAIEMGIAS